MSPRAIPTLLACLLLPASAAAHEGHGDPGLTHTAWHWLAEPVHLVPSLAALALAVFGARALRRRRAAARER